MNVRSRTTRMQRKAMSLRWSRIVLAPVPFDSSDLKYSLSSPRSAWRRSTSLHLPMKHPAFTATGDDREV